MTYAFVSMSGAAFAAALWFIASAVAQRRKLTLGAAPYWALLLCGVGAIGVASFLPPQTALLAGTSLIGAIVCAIVDARTGFIFDALSLTILLSACIVAVVAGRFAEAAVAAAVVGAGLGALYLITGRRGIGLGDVKLGSTIAFGYGLSAALVAIGSAFILGAAYAVIMLTLGRARRSDAVRFGPFLAGGAALGLTARVMGWPW